MIEKSNIEFYSSNHLFAGKTVALLENMILIETLSCLFHSNNSK